ncbi:MAG: hypothetical protein OCC46_17065 [Pseudodesulfovibrio sp.]
MRQTLVALSIFVALAICAFASPANAAQDSLPPTSWKKDGPQAHIERGLDLMVKGDFDSAFKALFGKGHTKEVLEKLKFEIYRLSKKSGNPYAYERIIEQTAGASVLRLRYLLLFDTKPVMFDFYYYKRKSGWALRSIHYSLDIKKIFVR